MEGKNTEQNEKFRNRDNMCKISSHKDGLASKWNGKISKWKQTHTELP